MPRKKRYYFIGVLIVLAVMVWFGKKPADIKTAQVRYIIPSVQTQLKEEKSVLPALQEKKSIFVPYWALGQDDFSAIPYDKIYYFGITADAEGIKKDDAGYKALDRRNCPNSQECVLILRLLDQQIAQQILDTGSVQQKIVTETLQIANAHFFSGIALDLEISGLTQEDTKERINKFVQLFSSSAKKDYKTFSFIIYGDNYYRKRPYDITFIGKQSDEVMLMAYDLQKSYGEPGPNFNFSNKKIYGYDFQTMISDFKTDIEPRKLTIIFGMYGYDWTLNEQGTPLKRAEAVTVNQINRLKMSDVRLQISVNQSKEKKMEYVDKEDQKHIIYYEDMESAAVKTQYLKEHGIGSISFWAYSYF